MCCYPRQLGDWLDMLETPLQTLQTGSTEGTEEKLEHKFCFVLFKKEKSLQVILMCPHWSREMFHKFLIFIEIILNSDSRAQPGSQKLTFSSGPTAGNCDAGNIELWNSYSLTSHGLKTSKVSYIINMLRNHNTQVHFLVSSPSPVTQTPHQHWIQTSGTQRTSTLKHYWRQVYLQWVPQPTPKI